MIHEPSPADRLILALDVGSREKAEELVTELDGTVTSFKVGHELYAAAGPDFVISLVQRGKRVLFDLKWIDIPETVASAVRVAANFGVAFATVDGNSDGKTMRAGVLARNAERKEGKDIKLLCVTVLTHLDDVTCLEIYGKTVRDLVRKRTEDALENGLDGVISSGKEVAMIRQIADSCKRDDFLIVTPGMRFPELSKDDHGGRACDPKSAIVSGASYIVVGRPIRDSNNKRAQAQRFIDAIRDGLEQRTKRQSPPNNVSFMAHGRSASLGPTSSVSLKI